MSPAVLTQESARRTLDRVLQVAVSHRLPDVYRLELGLAVEWLQDLVDSKVLSGRPASSAMPHLGGGEVRSPAGGCTVAAHGEANPRRVA
jgi:hypothetical protein